MTTQTRWILAVALIGLFAISTGTIAWAAWSFQSAGMISVEVMERGSNHIAVQIPAGIVTAAMAFVPADCLREASRELAPYWPAVQAAYEALEELPDAVFVEVDSDDEQVRIGKKDGQFYVQVIGPEERVQVRFPLAIIRPVLRKMQRLAPDVRSADKVKINLSTGFRPAL